MPAVQVAPRITLNNILLATDFSDVSMATLPYARALAQGYGAKLFVVHVVPYEPYVGVPMESPLPVEDDILWQRAELEFQKFPPSGSLAGVRHEEFLRRGELWTALSDLIRKNEIDLVIAGTHGRRGLKKVVLGSEAEKIYRRATCPVLTVGPHVHQPLKDGWRPKHILFATDFSEIAQQALPYALSLAEEAEGTLTLVNMMPMVSWHYQRALEERTRQKLDALLPEEIACRTESLVGFDFAAEGIIKVARQYCPDMIVMGVRKPVAATLQAHMPWSTASSVVNEAPCPVLTVRA